MRQPARARSRALRRLLILLPAGLISAAVFAVSGIGAPTNSGAPTVSGSFQDGGQLSADPGAWTAGSDVSYSYRWQDCSGYKQTVLGDTPASYWRLDDVPDPVTAVLRATD